MDNSTKNFVITTVALIFVGIGFLTHQLDFFWAVVASVIAVSCLHDLWDAEEEYDDVEFEFDEVSIGSEFPEEAYDGQTFFLEQQDVVLVFTYDGDFEVWDQIGTIARNAKHTV